MLLFVPLNAKKILEIGCGEGKFSIQLLNTSNEIWGFEPDIKSAEITSEKLHKVLIGTLDENLNDLPNNYFDLIIMNDVIEHLLYPWKDISNLKRKLSSKGVTIFSIPNFRYSKYIFN